jgi:hypothetical protein
METHPLALGSRDTELDRHGTVLSVSTIGSIQHDYFVAAR